jgi:hypothetical protein
LRIIARRSEVVHRDGHLEVDGAYYSAPPEYVTSHVWVRWDSRLVRIYSRIDLHFGKIQRGKRTECPFRSGEIHLRTDGGGIFGSVNRGDKI